MHNELLNFLSLDNTSTNLKWILLLVSPFAFYIIKFLLYLTIKFIRQNIHNQLSRHQNNSFIKNFSTMKFEHCLSWMITCLPMSIFVENFEYSPRIEKYLFILVKIIFAINAIKLAMMISDALCNLLTEVTQQTDHPLDKKITPLISKTLKLFIGIMGVLIFLQNLGVNVTAIIAGLGVGGVAIAFAAQNTVANVFGTITILLDMPFKIGDRIRVSGTEGSVEEIGFRSTRIRTATNTLVCIPNSIVAGVQIDNLSEINSVYRFKTVLAFEQISTTEKISKFCEEFSYELKQDSRVVQKSAVVYFSDITEYSKNVTVAFQYNGNDSAMNENQYQELYLYKLEALTKKVELKFAQNNTRPLCNG